MEPLGTPETLGQALSGLLGPTLAAAVRAAWTPSEQPLPPESYLYLPPTEYLEAALLEAHRILYESPPLDPAQMRQARRKMQVVAERIEQARERDQLQAAQPEGCWCLGWGGRNEKAEREGSAQLWRIGHEYCDCAAGSALRMADAEANAAARAADSRDLRARIEHRLLLPQRLSVLTLDGYPVSDVTRRPWLGLTRWARESLANSAILIGPQSTGKTGLAAAALHEKALLELKGGLYVTAPGLLRQIKDGWSNPKRGEDGGEEDFFRRVEMVPLLLLDDLGKEHVTDWAATTMFEMIDGRHGANRPTLVTSNLDLDELGARIGLPNLERLQEMAGRDYEWVFDFTGAPNLRVRA